MSTLKIECKQIGNGFDVTLLGEIAANFIDSADAAGHGAAEVDSELGWCNYTTIRFQRVKDAEVFKTFCKNWHPPISN